MTAATIITLRETLEASLVVGIVLTYLHTIAQTDHNKWVWRGVWAGCGVSLVLAAIFHLTMGGFTGTAEALYEGIIMLVTAGLITGMITWMLKQKQHMRRHIEQEVDKHVERNHPLGIFFLVFFSVVREGIETVLFLHAAYLQASGAGMQLLGASLGIAIAILIAVLFFRGMGHLSMRWCFSVTTFLLILFAAGLVAHGVHELQEAGVIPIIVEQMWDINHILDEKGAVGGIMKGVFGYNGNPTLLEIVSYLVYLLGIGAVWQRLNTAK